MKINFGKLKAISKGSRRNILLATALVIICSAVYLNWRFSQGDANISGIISQEDLANASAEEASGDGGADEVSGAPDNGSVLGETAEVSASGDDYFSVSVINRRRVRDEALEILQTVLDSADALPDTKDRALLEMTSIADCMTSEVNIENLVLAKGFDDCVAIVDGDGAQVIVKSDGLLPGEVAQIRAIVLDQSDALAENIKIIEKK